MVRSGEYSPNHPGNSNVAGGIFGLGEYEEKRKYYNEQRKLEYKEFIAQRGQENSSKCKGNTQGVFACRNLIENNARLNPNRSKSTTGQSDATTQTERCELRDASTSTNNDRLDKIPESVSHEYISNVNMEKSSHDRNTLYTEGAVYNDDTSPRSLHKETQAFRKEVVQGGQEEGIIFGRNEKRGRKLNIDSPASYKRELRAQIEERRKIKSELDEKERQEASGRDIWLAEEAKRELAKHRTEEERTRALEDLRKQRMEKFLHCTEQLRREAEEMRKSKRRNNATQNVVPVVESDVNGANNPQRQVGKLDPPKSGSKNAIYSHRSVKSRSSIKDSNVNKESNGMPMHSSASSRDSQEIPIHNMSINEEYLNLSAEKSLSKHGVLTQLGEIRRQLFMEQLRMEEAIQKTSL